MERLKYITVFDYENADVNTYELVVWEIEDENGKTDIESTLINLGHNPTNCEWMLHLNKPIIH